MPEVVATPSPIPCPSCGLARSMSFGQNERCSSHELEFLRCRVAELERLSGSMVDTITRLIERYGERRGEVAVA